MFWFDFAWEIQNVLNQWWWQINFSLLVILVILGWLSWKNPIYGISLTIILMPTYLFRSQVWFFPFTYLEICIWVVFLTWFIRSIITNRLRQGFSKYYRWPIILILLGATISLFISPTTRQAAGLWKAYFIEPIMFFMVAVNTVKTKRDKELILWALGLSTISISLLAIYQKFSAFGIFEPGWIAPDKRRVTSIFSSPNAVGLYLGPIVVLYISWLIDEFKNHKAGLLKILIVVSSLLAIYFTVSQGTWLGLAAAIIFLAFFGWSKKWTGLAITGLILIAIILPVTREKLWPMITFSDVSGQNRITLFQMSTSYLTDNTKNLLLGGGILGFAEIQNSLRDPLKLEALLYPHNFILNFWLEIGLVGLVGFGWLAIKFFTRGFNILKTRRDWLTLGVMAAIVATLAHGLIDVPYFKNDLAVLFWIIIALL